MPNNTNTGRSWIHVSALRGRWLNSAVLAMALFGLFALVLGFFGDWNWFADLFAHPRAQYCAWFGTTIAAAFYLRQRVALWIGVVGLCINGAVLFPYALPWRKAPETQRLGAPLKLISLNLLYGNRDAGRVCGYLRETKADIVVFQELGPFWATALKDLADVYPYRTMKPRKDGFGIGVFSRTKPLAVDIRKAGEREGDYAVFATWEQGGRKFHVVGVHPDKPDAQWKTRNRRVYLDAVAQWCNERAKADEPVVALGDFNATPWSASMRRFTTQTATRTTTQGVVFGATWNVYQPQRLLIDHALVSPHWDLLQRTVGPDVGSDHRPLAVEIAIRQ